MDVFVEWFFSPIGQGVVWGVVGILLKTFAPGWIPMLGGAKKLADELIELHKKNSIPNANIVASAYDSGMKTAARVLEKELLTSGEGR